MVDRHDESAGFETIIGLRGRDLVIIGDGDPSLGDPQAAEELGIRPLAFLDLWAHALIASGNDSIRGDLIIDATAFDGEPVHPHWEAGDLVKWYGAPVGGLNLANNCVELTLHPGAAHGALAAWSLFPLAPAVVVENRCTSSPGTKSAMPAVGRRPGTFELVLSGKVSEPVTLQPVSIPDPVVFAATSMQAHLEQAGVAIAGDIRYARVRLADGTLPTDLHVLARHRTPLATVLRRVGADSQNMCAEALLKRLGHAWATYRNGHDVPGSWSNGREATAAFLHRIGCDLNTLTIADGSGLSRRNRATASEFVRVLSYMHEHPRRELFMASLAGNRTGGTLRRRLRNIDGEVYAKTGYMSGVRALSGYVHSDADRWYAFSVIFNGFSGSSQPYNDKLRDLCRLLAENP
jgi:D-alanyl-D-alanine carboxypeptidase/D-alanyl-D-alanine-endopeptidase (penicillin-binding protein 4)